MKKLTFIEKNDAVVRLKNPEHFDKDCELLRKLNPGSKLHNEIAKVNEFSINSVCGRVLLELLDFAPISDIEKNRELKKPVKKQQGSKVAAKQEAPAPAVTTEAAPVENPPAEEAPAPAITEEIKKKVNKSNKSTQE